MKGQGISRAAGRSANRGGRPCSSQARPSMSRLAYLVALAFPVGGGLGLALGSCSDGADTASPRGGAAGADAGESAADASQDQASGAGGATGAAGGGGEAGGTLPCGLPYAEAWAPGVDSCFRPVDWPAPCNVEVAEQPHLAVPPLEWEPCDGQAGCERMVVKWDHMDTPAGAATVVRQGDAYLVGLALEWSEDGEVGLRSAVYGVDGMPLAVWRGDPKTHYCLTNLPLVTSSRVWIGALSIDDQGGTSAAYTAPAYADLATTAEILPMTTANQGSSASDDLLLLEGMSGFHMTIYDRLAGTAQAFGSAGFPAYQEGQPVGESALVMCLEEYDRPKLCIWNRTTQAIEPLVTPVSEVVPVAKSDGQTLVWAQNPPVHQPSGAWQPGALWMSPMATEAADLVAEKRCAAPDLGPSVAGHGYFAMASQIDMVVHFYRLSDMQHWAIPAPPGQTNGTIRRLAHIDGEFLWYNTHYLHRQRLDALGPGAPCPAPP